MSTWGSEFKLFASFQMRKISHVNNVKMKKERMGAWTVIVVSTYVAET